MKKGFKWKLIGILAAISSVFILAGCKFSRTVDEVRNEYGATAQVTYYANGGIFNNDKSVKNLYYKPGDRVFEIGGGVMLQSGTVNVSRDNYTLEGWYYVELDGEGNPLYEDEAKTVLKLGDKVQFDVAIQDEQHWVIAANWVANVKVNAVLVYDGTTQITTADGATYQNGDVVKTFNYGADGKVGASTSAPFTAANGSHTFLAYYADAACTQKLDWTTLARGDEDQTVYVKYIEGNWRVLKDASDVKSYLFGYYSGMATTRFYLLNDIDCSGLSNISPVTAFAAELQGNGHKISNLTVTKKNLGNNGKTSVFGNIEKTAKMQNVTFENLSFNVTTSAPLEPGFAEVYYVFTSMAADIPANAIENVTITGSTTIDCANTMTISNLVNGTDGWIFGGYATDSAYVAAYPNGFNVTATVTEE